MAAALPRGRAAPVDGPWPSPPPAAASFFVLERARRNSIAIGTTEMSTIRMSIASMFLRTNSICPSAAPSSVTPTPQSTPPMTLNVMNER